MKILVTGFDPFGGEPINPAIESVKKLPDNIAGAQIIKLEIPTVKGKSIKKIEKAIEEHFICNHVLYGTLYLINKKYKDKKSGFIHIPFLPEQVINKKNIPSMELNTIVKGLIAAIETIVKNDKDIKETGGTIC